MSQVAECPVCGELFPSGEEHNTEYEAHVAECIERHLAPQSRLQGSSADQCPVCDLNFQAAGLHEDIER